MYLDKRDVDKLLQDKATKKRQATIAERTILETELVKLLQMYRETNKLEMLIEITNLVNSLDQLNVKVVSEDEKTIHFEVAPMSGQQYGDTFFCRVEK